VVFYGGDPGIAVLLVPVGAASMMIAVFLLARMAASTGHESGSHEAGTRPRQDRSRGTTSRR